MSEKLPASKKGKESPKTRESKNAPIDPLKALGSLATSVTDTLFQHPLVKTTELLAKHAKNKATKKAEDLKRKPKNSGKISK